jgi:deazaflavin-dependent oxidoreductase (nitroreductase family)
MTTLGAARHAHGPRFGGLLWRIVRRTNELMLPLAGKTWNPVFAVVVHRGRRSGLAYATPVAVRRHGEGFVISLSFGAQVDWYRNLVAAGGGIVRWRGREFSVSAPQTIDPTAGLNAFHPIQRFFLRLGRIDGFVHLADTGAGSR